VIVDLTEAERLVVDTRYSMGKSLTLAWRAFGKIIGVPVDDPIMVIDGDGSQYEPITGRYFDFEEAEGDRYLSLGYCGCWDGGAMRSLSPDCTYISYSVAPDGSFVDFHGWHKPKGESRIISPAPNGRAPFLTKDGLSSMTVLIGVMKRLIVQAGRT
jgi:hypothetical protein